MQTETTTFWQFLTRSSMGRVWVIILVLASLSSLLFTCSAQAREVVDTPQGRVVKSADCLLVGNAMNVRGACSVGRNIETNNTLVVMNSLHMLIRRSEEEGAATAYIVEDDRSLSPIATVVAVGNCWVGYRFRFCAK